MPIGEVEKRSRFSKKEKVNSSRINAKLVLWLIKKLCAVLIKVHGAFDKTPKYSTITTCILVQTIGLFRIGVFYGSPLEKIAF